jgi:hypothetical protein
MKAWRVYGVGDIRLDDVPYPKAGAIYPAQIVVSE